jgi:hypothetical protein
MPFSPSPSLSPSSSSFSPFHAKPFLTSSMHMSPFSPSPLLTSVSSSADFHSLSQGSPHSNMDHPNNNAMNQFGYELTSKYAPSYAERLGLGEGAEYWEVYCMSHTHTHTHTHTVTHTQTHLHTQQIILYYYIITLYYINMTITITIKSFNH